MRGVPRPKDPQCSFLVYSDSWYGRPGRFPRTEMPGALGLHPCGPSEGLTWGGMVMGDLQAGGSLLPRRGDVGDCRHQ